MKKRQIEGLSSNRDPLPKSTEYPRDLCKCDSAVIVRRKRARDPEYSYMQKALNYIISLAKYVAPINTKKREICHSTGNTMCKDPRYSFSMQ